LKKKKEKEKHYGDEHLKEKKKCECDPDIVYIVYIKLVYKVNLTL